MAPKAKPTPVKRVNIFLRLLGPGLVTGAADDDPSGIATYSQAGAQFGYGLLWLWDYVRRYRVAVGFASLAICICRRQWWLLGNRRWDIL